MGSEMCIRDRFGGDVLGHLVSEPRVAEVGPVAWLKVLAMRAAGVWIASFVGYLGADAALTSIELLNGGGVKHAVIGSTGTAIVTIVLPAVSGVARAMSQRSQPRLRLPGDE